MKKPLFVLGAASLFASEPAFAESSSLIENVPHVMQKPDFCGEACVEMVLKTQGSTLDQDDVFQAGGVDPALGRGLWTREMKRAVEHLGFSPGKVWFEVRASDAERELRALWTDVAADLRRGVPSIVCMHYHDDPNTTEHFRLLLGYDAATDEVIYHEPAVARAAYQRMKLPLFLKLWPLKYDEQVWTVVRLKMESARDARFARHVAELKKKAPPQFTIVVEPPFVVLGDEPADRVRARAKSTVRWAVEKLKADFFARDPDEILDVWLFKDRASYEKHATRLFKVKPSTPYGYYSRTDRALVMNIATGGGTLVHEIVHPFMEANFPESPAWFNEGLGSLYEQSGDEGGHIHGYTNWRLAGLQQALEENVVPNFAKLTAMSDDKFYDDDTGVNYAASRYLLYYLQERGLLVQFSRDFMAAKKSDPSGYQTLVKTLGEKNMVAFERRWRTFVLNLKFPG